MALNVEIALLTGLGGGQDQYFTLDDPTRGLLDSSSYLLAYFDVFATVTSDVRRVTISRGRSTELDRVRAGQCTIELNNHDRTYDPSVTPPITTRTNLVPNPSFEVDTTGWASMGGSPTRTTTSFQYGVASVSFSYAGAGSTGGIQTTGGQFIPVTAGVQYALSAWVRQNIQSGLLIINVIWYAADGSTLIQDGTHTNITPTTSFSRVSQVVTCPAGAALARLRVYKTSGESGGATSVTVFVDGILFEQASSVGDYFDGSVSTGSIVEVSRQWNGTADNSTSTLVSYPTGVVTPYVGNIRPRKAVRVDVDGLRVFTGQVEDWSFTYQVGGDSVAGVNAVDGFSLLAQANLAGTSFPAESTGSRITAVTALTSVGWPTANLDVDAGLATVAAGSVSATDNALGYLQQVEASEPGVLFINRGGTLEFRDRSAAQTTPTILFSSSAGTQIPYTAIEVEYGTEQLHNRVVVTTPTGTVTTGDTTSQANYGLLSRDFPTLLSTDAQATDLAGYLLAQYKDPTFRIRRLGVMVNDLTSAQRSQVVGLDLGDRVRVTFTPNNIGTAIVKDLTVEQIDHDLEPLGVSTQVHRMTLGLSEAVSAFTLDVDLLDSPSPYGF